MPPHDRSSNPAATSAPSEAPSEAASEVASEVASDRTTADRCGAIVPGGCTPGPPVEQVTGIVDWQRTGRRLRRQLVVIAVLVLAVWMVLGIAGDGLRLRTLAELLGVGALASVAAEILVVGGAAVRGLLAAGDRGDRLASSDVSLLPPQLSRRLQRRR